MADRFMKMLVASFLTIGCVAVHGLVLESVPGIAAAMNPDDKEQERLDKSARKTYDQASDSYDDGDYWKAAVDLIVILDYYSTYTELDDVVYLLGNCLYEMEMYNSADRMYRYLLKEVGKTNWISHALLGLQKSAYQKADFDQSLKFYRALESHYVDDDNIYESRYYAVQTYYKLENYEQVLFLIKHIDEKSDFYPFARYTVGLSHIKKKTLEKLSRACCKLYAHQQKGLKETISAMPAV